MAHLTVAVSERAFKESFKALVRNFSFAAADSANFGPFTAGYDVKAHLEGGSIDLRSDGSLKVSELDVRWDRFILSLGLDIGTVCVGGGCIDLPWPLPDLCLPRFCIFEDSPDVSIAPDLASFIAQEISFEGSLAVQYFDASAPLPSPDLCSPIRINPLPTSNQWQIFILPGPIDLDLFDFPDIVGNLIEDALTAAITALIPGGPVRDLILVAIGGIADLIRSVLDIPDDIEEWLSDLFNISFGLVDILGQIVGLFLGACNPVYQVPDPYEILPAEGGLVPVSIPIANLSVAITADEVVAQATVG